MKSSARLSQVILPLLILAIAVGILLPVSPINRTVPAVDTSVFMYIGQRILEGEVPYRDAWDHKQPLVYLLYAVGLWITPGSLWGTWLLIVGSVSLTGVICYAVLQQLSGKLTAFIAVMVGLLTLYPILWGGSIEELALVCQAGALFSLMKIQTSPDLRRKLLHGGGLGIWIGLAFFLKQSLIAAGVAALIYLVLEYIITRRRQEWLVFPVSAAGFMIVAAPLFTYLGMSGALDEYWNAAFVFNSRYAGLGPLEQFTAALDALEFMSGMPGLFVSIAAWFCALGILFIKSGPLLASVLANRKIRVGILLVGGILILASLIMELLGGTPGFGLFQMVGLLSGGVLVVLGVVFSVNRFRGSLMNWLNQTPGSETLPSRSGSSFNLIGFMVLYFPLILFFLTISGRNYVYYFIMFIPYVMISLGGVIGEILQHIQGPTRKMVGVVLISLLVSVGIVPGLQLATAYQAQTGQSAVEIADYIKSNSQPEETILAWGKPATYVYIMAERKAPTRHFYQASIFEDGYNSDFLVCDEIAKDLESSPPRYFLNYSEARIDVPAGQCALAPTDEYNTPGQIFKIICEQYVYEGQVGDFQVFRLP